MNSARFFVLSFFNILHERIKFSQCLNLMSRYPLLQLWVHSAGPLISSFNWYTSTYSFSTQIAQWYARYQFCQLPPYSLNTAHAVQSCAHLYVKVSKQFSFNAMFLLELFANYFTWNQLEVNLPTYSIFLSKNI